MQWYSRQSYVNTGIQAITRDPGRHVITVGNLEMQQIREIINNIIPQIRVHDLAHWKHYIVRYCTHVLLWRRICEEDAQFIIARRLRRQTKVFDPGAESPTSDGTNPNIRNFLIIKLCFETIPRTRTICIPTSNNILPSHRRRPPFLRRGLFTICFQLPVQHMLGFSVWFSVFRLTCFKVKNNNKQSISLLSFDVGLSILKNWEKI